MSLTPSWLHTTDASTAVTAYQERYYKTSLSPGDKLSQVISSATELPTPSKFKFNLLSASSQGLIQPSSFLEHSCSQNRSSESTQPTLPLCLKKSLALMEIPADHLDRCLGSTDFRLHHTQCPRAALISFEGPQCAPFHVK